MLSKLKSTSLAYRYSSIGIVGTEEIKHHSESLLRGNYLRFGIILHKFIYISGMIGLHMLNYKIIGSLAAESFINVIKPFV